VLTVPPQLILYPVGAGATRRLDAGELQSYDDARFFPGDSTILVCGSKSKSASRCYARSLAGGPLRPITPEGTSWGATISPDGRTILARTGEQYRLYPLDGGVPRAVPALVAGDRVVRWTPDGRSLWVTRDREVPLRLEELDLASGKRRLLRTFQPGIGVGVFQLGSLTVADDPGTYAYNAMEFVGRIFVVTGMK
jgi:Tol biopolymer transport system component